MQRRCQNAPLTDCRPSQILRAQVVDGIAGIVDNQVAEHEILVEAHLLRRLAEHFIAQILRQRGKGCVARVRERIGQALHAMCASVCHGIAADRIIARAVKGEVVQIRQVFQRGRHGHDFECRAGRIKPLRCAVDQCARGFIRQCRIHVRRVELRHGHERQNFVGLVIQHDDRAALIAGKLFADIAREPLGDGQFHIISALCRAGKGIGKPLEDARAEAEQILRVERIRAGGYLAAAVADDLADSLARRGV